MLIVSILHPGLLFNDKGSIDNLLSKTISAHTLDNLVFIICKLVNWLIISWYTCTSSTILNQKTLQNFGFLLCNWIGYLHLVGFNCSALVNGSIIIYLSNTLLSAHQVVNTLYHLCIVKWS